MSNDSKFSMPEPPPEVPSGVLTEIWQQSEPLPRLRGLELFLYFLQRGLHTAVALPTSNTITVLTVAVSLFLFSAFLLVV